jgi:hypothetical protein
MMLLNRTIAISLVIASLAFGQYDPSCDDTLVIGNLDSSPIIAGPGEQVNIPVWIWSEDSLTCGQIPVATDNGYVVSRNGGNFHVPFSLWDDVSFLWPRPDSLLENHTTQAILGYAYLTDPRDPQNFLHTGGDWWHIADFRITIVPDTAIIGQSSDIRPGYDPIIGTLIFGAQDGAVAYYPITLYGTLNFLQQNGDANFSGDVNGLDVVYLVNYFKLGTRPPVPFLSGDTNGDCSVNGLDVVWLVNYLKGLGPEPLRRNCP